MTTHASTELDPAWWAPGLRSPEDAEVLPAVDKAGTRRDIRMYVGGLLEARGGDGGRPQGFLVPMGPNEVIGSHFHRIDQFQVFFGTEGARYQRTPLEPGTVIVHYTDAYSTYGPISSGDNGLTFFTLRAFGDPFSAYMPGSRDLLIHRGRRIIDEAFSVDDCPPLDTDAVEVTSIVDEQDDHLFCRRVRAGAGAAYMGPSPAEGAGQYYCVVGGEVLVGDRLFGPKSLAWVASDGEPLELRAASTGGFDAIIMQFPSPPTVALPDLN